MVRIGYPGPLLNELEQNMTIAFKPFLSFA